MSPSPIRFVRETLHHIGRIRQVHRAGRAGRAGTRAVAAAAILLLAAAAAGASGFAALSWNNAAGGSASTPTNWTPNQVPTSADDLTFNIVGTYDVTLNAGTPASRSQTFRRGNVSLTASSPHAISNGIIVGSVSGDLATTTLSSGAITSSSAVVVGSASGSTGTLNVSGASSDLVLATTAGDLTVGNNGAGELNVTSGGLVQVADRFVSGGNSVAAADISVSGRMLISPFTRSTLDVAGTSLASTVGSGGDVTMSVTNGGRADFAGSLNVAQGSASSSSLTIGGAGINASNVAVGGDLRVGGNTSAGSAAGVGVLTVGAIGTLDVVGALEVGNDPDGGTGFLVLDQGATVTTGSLNVGATGELDLDGGTLDIDGGTFTYTHPTVGLIVGGPDAPVVTLSNGVAGTITSVVAGRALTVAGGAGVTVGDFDVRSGSTLSVPSGDIVLGDTVDDFGKMIVNGTGSSLTMSPTSKLVVGLTGDAELQIEEFATASLGTLQVGANFGSTAVVAFELGGTVNVEDVFVGGTSAGEGGFGDFRVSAGTVCHVASPGGIVKVWPSSILYVLGGTLNSDSVLIEGDFVVENNSLNNGSINAEAFVLAGGDGDAEGAINSSVHIASPLSKINAAGDLILGDASTPFGFRNSGVLDCNAETVTLLDSDLAVLNTALIDGGTLIAPNGCFISSTDSLYGFGTIDADISNSGKIIATDAAGLTFKGIVSGDGQGFRGTVANFIDGGGFIGDGDIDASITADSSSTFTLTGDLQMGAFLSNDQISIDGAIDVGAHSLMLNDPDAAELGGTTTLDGGSVFANDVLLRSGGLIIGSGDVLGRFIGESNSCITATGSLYFGSGFGDGFQTAGRIEVGTDTVTIFTDDDARLGRSTTIAGGTLSHLGDGFFVLETGDTLSGFGTVLGGISQGSGSVIRAEGALTIGALPSGMPILADGGLLDINSSTVTLLGTSSATLTPTTTIAGGTLNAEAPILVQGTGVLSGHGTLTAPVVNTGTIEVGSPIGTLTLSDGLAHHGTIAVQIGGGGSGPGAENESPSDVVIAKSGVVATDLIQVTGTAELNASGVSTLRIGQLPGLVVEEGDRFSILIADSIAGTFAQVIFDDPYLDNVFDVQYTATRVNLVATAATGVELPPGGDPSDGSPSGDGVTGGVLPEAFGLRLASRNPFTADLGVAFEFDVPRGGAPVPVAIAVFDASGRRVAHLVNGARAAGTHAERWTSADLRALPSGVYFLRMDAGGFGATKRLVLVR
ncbi:MAG: beta strand repeat-containing protein [bacterium]